MKPTGHFYQFWITSSRGTDQAHIRRYESKPTKEQLKLDVESWCESFGAWHVSENTVSYGWKPLTRLPKNRAECLAKYQKFCDTRKRAADKVRLLGGLLQHYK